MDVAVIEEHKIKDKETEINKRHWMDTTLSLHPVINVLFDYIDRMFHPHPNHSILFKPQNPHDTQGVVLHTLAFCVTESILSNTPKAQALI